MSENIARSERHLSSDDYERDIERTRGEIDETLHSLEARLSPREIWQRTVDEWGEEVKDFSGNFGRAMRDNPVPAVLMGVSLLWLMSGYAPERMRMHPGHRGRFRERLHEARERFQEARAGTSERAGVIAEKASDITGSAKKTYGEMQQKVGEMGRRMRHLAHEAASRSGEMRRTGSEWSEKAREQGQDFFSRPLFLAAAGLALGSLAALSMPISRQEERLMAEKGGEVLDKAKDIWQEKAEQGKRAAAAAGAAARSELKGEET